MGCARPTHPRTSSAPRRARSPMETPPCCYEWSPLGLRTGAPWAELPNRYPPYQTCHRRFQQWVRSGILRGVLEALAEDLRVQGRLDVREAFIDGSFAPAKKGDPRSVTRSAAKGRRS